MKFKNIKCIIIDIDGTLTNSNSEVTEYTKTVINKLVKQNIKVILASGRNIDNIIEVSKISWASSIVIANNGSTIYDYSNNKFLFLSTIDIKLINKVLNLCLKYNVDSIYNSLNLRYRNYKCLDKSYNEKNDIDIKNIDDINTDIFQIVLLGKNVNEFNCCINEIKKYELEVCNTAKGKNVIIFADINLIGTTKGKAVKELRRLLNIKKDDIICFGDSINDIDMFQSCGIKVAMKNSIQELKQYADYITKYSNDENGVAKFLESNLNVYDKTIDNK